MSLQGTVGLHFYLDAKAYAFRRWHFVPRAGDIVMLHDPNRSADGKRYPAIVNEVVWNTGPEDAADRGMIEVSLDISWAKSAKPKVQKLVRPTP